MSTSHCGTQFKAAAAAAAAAHTVMIADYLIIVRIATDAIDETALLIIRHVFHRAYRA